MKREKSVNDIMNSLDSIQRAKAPADGFVKIQQKLADQRKSSIEPKKQTNFGWLKVAAVIAFVVCSNAWAVSNYLTSDLQSENTGSDSYSQITTDFNLYGND